MAGLRVLGPLEAEAGSISVACAATCRPRLAAHWARPGVIRWAD